MPNTLFGLPLHPLIVHATVVMIPLAALAVLLSVFSSRFRTWAGPLPLGLSLFGLILVPLSTSSGETLEHHMPQTAMLSEHAHLADGLLPWMIGLVVFSAIGYLLHRRTKSGTTSSKPLRVTVAVLAVAAVVGTTVQVGRIGHSGAKAAWENTDMNSSQTDGDRG